jgi:hypothetical protein
MKNRPAVYAAGIRCLTGVFVLLLLVAAGCATDERPSFTLEERLQASSPEPPPILSVAVLSLFTNQPSFGAECRVDYGAASNRRPLNGAFLRRGDQFLFAAEAQEKKARGREMTFIWDATANQGRALNDALPGYAPLVARPSVTAVQSTGKAPAEKVNGHPTSQEKLMMTLNDGSEVHLTVWRADDMRGIPVRVRSDAGPARYTIDLSDFRFQEPNVALFEVPPDFTKYDSPKAMFDELFRRDSIARRERKTKSSFDEEEWQRTGAVRPNL